MWDGGGTECGGGFGPAVEAVDFDAQDFVLGWGVLGLRERLVMGMLESGGVSE